MHCLKDALKLLESFFVLGGQPLSADIAENRIPRIIGPAARAADHALRHGLCRRCLVLRNLRNQILPLHHFGIVALCLRVRHVLKRHSADLTGRCLARVGMPAVGTADPFLPPRIQDRLRAHGKHVRFRQELAAHLAHYGIIRIITITKYATHCYLSPAARVLCQSQPL